MVNYYKLISGTNIVGIATSLEFRRFQKKNKIILICNEQSAQYVQYGDILYHDNWMLPITTDLYKYEVADIIQIEETEYNALKSALEVEDEIVIEPETPVEVEPEVTDPNADITVDYIKNVKIAEMSNTCNKIITNGIDVQLSDGNTYHFSLTTQDQLNLITLSTLIAAGQTEIPYHADGELCRYYSVKDITIITETATAHKTYHVTYFNSLKAWVSAMDNIDDITAVQYGTTIPEEYQSDILKEMLRQMAGGSV